MGDFLNDHLFVAVQIKGIRIEVKVQWNKFSDVSCVQLTLAIWQICGDYLFSRALLTFIPDYEPHPARGP